MIVYIPFVYAETPRRQGNYMYKNCLDHRPLLSSPLSSM